MIKQQRIDVTKLKPDEIHPDYLASAEDKYFLSFVTDAKKMTIDSIIIKEVTK